MKFSLLAVACLSISTIFTVGSSVNNTASAQCVQTVVGVQANISGSRQPTERSNDVQMTSQGPCTGNAQVTTGVQLNEGGSGRVIQRRTVRQQMNGGSDNGTGVDGSTVQIQVTPGIDVYNPADNYPR